MSVFKKDFPDSYQLAEDSLKELDGILEKVDDWKEDRFAHQLLAFQGSFSEELRTALIIRSLENCGMKVGLPDDRVLNAFFAIIDDTAVIVMDKIMSEDIRL